MASLLREQRIPLDVLCVIREAIASVYGSNTEWCFTLTNCCLVCRLWNEVFRPLLYGHVLLTTDEAASKVRRILWHRKPNDTSLVRYLRINYHRSTSLSTWTIMFTKLPRLREITFVGIDIPKMHPSFTRYLKLLLKTRDLKVHMYETYFATETHRSMLSMVKFLKAMPPMDAFISLQLAEELSKTSDYSPHYSEEFLNKKLVSKWIQDCGLHDPDHLTGLYIRLKSQSSDRECRIQMKKIQVQLLEGFRKGGLPWTPSLCSTFQTDDSVVLIAYLPYDLDSVTCARLDSLISGMGDQVERTLLRQWIYHGRQDYSQQWKTRFPILSRKPPFIMDVIMHPRLNPGVFHGLVVDLCSLSQQARSDPPLVQSRYRNCRKESYDHQLTRTSLWTCSLLNHHWHGLIMPLLYQEIVVDNSRTEILLRRTLQSKPECGKLIYKLDIIFTSNLWFTFAYRRKYPNLAEVTLWKFDIAFSSHSARHLAVLAKYCKLVIHADIHPSSPIAEVVKFLQQSRPRQFEGKILCPQSDGNRRVTASTIARIISCRARFSFDTLRNDDNFTALNLCLKSLNYHLRDLRLSFNTPPDDNTTLDLQYNTSLRSLWLCFQLEESNETSVTREAIVSWFKSICLTINTNALRITFVILPKDPDLFAQLESSVSELKTSGRVWDLEYTLSNDSNSHSGNQEYWRERFHPFG